MKHPHIADTIMRNIARAKDLTSLQKDLFIEWFSNQLTFEAPAWKYASRLDRPVRSVRRAFDTLVERQYLTKEKGHRHKVTRYAVHPRLFNLLTPLEGKNDAIDKIQSDILGSLYGDQIDKIQSDILGSLCRVTNIESRVTNDDIQSDKAVRKMSLNSEHKYKKYNSHDKCKHIIAENFPPGSNSTTFLSSGEEGKEEGEVEVDEDGLPTISTSTPETQITTPEPHLSQAEAELRTNIAQIEAEQGRKFDPQFIAKYIASELAKNNHKNQAPKFGPMGDIIGWISLD